MSCRLDGVIAMSAREPKAGASRLGRFVRLWRFDHNPLRRATDRLETAVLALLVAGFLVGAPVATLATGAWIHDMAQRTQSAQEASSREVTAVVLAVTDPTAGRENLVAGQAQARWTAPDGREVTHEVPVPSGTVVGGTLHVWTDRTGDLTAAPLLDSQVADQSTTAEVAGALVSAGVLALAGTLAHWTLNRRRMAAWDTDWHATGPRWTTRA
jgi:hypothetical protein